MATSRSLAELQVMVKVQAQELEQLGVKLDRIERKLRTAPQAYRNLQRAGKAAGIALMGIGIAAAGVAVAAVKTGMAFDKQMSSVRAKTGATGAEFERLRSTALQLGADTVFSASQAAEGMTLLGAAGFKTTDIIGAMPGLLAGAAASGSDFATMVDIGVSAMSAWNLKAQDMGRISDVLTVAANESTAEVTDLGMAMKYVGPVAAKVGIGIEDTAAALAILANNGIKADMAGTSLRMALVRLAKPPKMAKEAMEKLNWTAVDSNGRFKDLGVMLEELQVRYKPLTDAQKLQTTAMLFGTEAASSMLTLIESGGPKFDAMAGKMDNATGAAERQAKVMTDNFAGALEQMKGSLETASIGLSDTLTPYLRNAAKAVERWADAWNKMDDAKQRRIVENLAKLAGVLAAGFVVSKAAAGISGLIGLVRDLNTVLGSALAKMRGLGAAGAGGAGAGAGGAGAGAGAGAAAGAGVSAGLLTGYAAFTGFILALPVLAATAAGKVQELTTSYEVQRDRMAALNMTAGEWVAMQDSAKLALQATALEGNNLIGLHQRTVEGYGPMIDAQRRVNEAQANYNTAVATYGPLSQQAVTAAGNLSTALATLAGYQDGSTQKQAALNQQVNLLPAHPTTTITTNAGAVRQQFLNLHTAIDNLPQSRFLTVHTTYTTSGQGSTPQPRTPARPSDKNRSNESGGNIHPLLERPTGGGSGGLRGVTINVNANVSDGFDLDRLAAELSSRVTRRLRTRGVLV